MVLIFIKYFLHIHYDYPEFSSFMFCNVLNHINHFLVLNLTCIHEINPTGSLFIFCFQYIAVFSLLTFCLGLSHLCSEMRLTSNFSFSRCPCEDLNHETRWGVFSLFLFSGRLCIRLDCPP